MRLTQKGQVTIPLRLRKRYGLAPHTEVVFEEAEGGVLIRPAPEAREKHLRKALKSVRGTADAGLTTDGILRLTRDE